MPEKKNNQIKIIVGDILNVNVIETPKPVIIPKPIRDKNYFIILFDDLE